MPLIPFHSSHEPPCPASARPHDVDIVWELRHLVRSAEPAVVFSSVARLCVPLFADACTVDIVEAGEVAYRIAFGDSASASRGAGVNYSICTSFASEGPDDVDGGYVGMMTHYRRGRGPFSAVDVARATLVARHSVAIVAEERNFSDAGTVSGVRVSEAATAAPVSELRTPLSVWARAHRQRYQRLRIVPGTAS